MPISFGMDRGRMMTRHMMKRANRWSVYQWYGISPSLDPVTVSYREIHTEEEQVKMNIIYLLQHEVISIQDNTEQDSPNPLRLCRFTIDSITFFTRLQRVVYDFLMARYMFWCWWMNIKNNENIPVNVPLVLEDISLHLHGALHRISDQMDFFF